MKRIELIEHGVAELAASALAVDDALLIWQRYSRYVDVRFPDPTTGMRWRLSARSDVGLFPVNRALTLVVRPKIGVRDLFGLIAHAYGLTKVRFLGGRVTCDTVEGLYAVLARELACRVLQRAKRGFYRVYRREEGELAVLRGRLRMECQARRPIHDRFQCDFEVHTSDVETNQVVLWALYLAARGLAESIDAAVDVRRAMHSLRPFASLCPVKTPFLETYNRLNFEYRDMHVLANFLIDSTGPAVAEGDSGMLPFVVNMDRVFERFVEGCLRDVASGNGRVVLAQHWIGVGSGGMRFVADIVLCDRSRRPIAVVDAKYRDVQRPGADEVAQVVAYATALGVKEAFLVYPGTVSWSSNVGDINVSAVGLDVASGVDGACFAAQRLLM